ncbi:DUF2244 domain-containing protein [Frigidibacter sp. SLM-1]|nr:DUF2244 domain-containing protein [Frigidibacter sp. ROC022]MCR8725268.1 DUF2244 domain-containing protein [Frigidibacter sp. ROC022]
MPYHWSENVPHSPGAGPDRPQVTLTLWPYRSLPPQGFVAFIAVTFVLLMVPVLGLLGQAALWGMLPYVLGALALTWVLLRRSYRDGALREVLTITDEAARLVRIDPDGRERSWEANPYWVRVEMQETGGPVENYLTLHGGPRTVEIGAFLGPEERVALRNELVAAFANPARR